MEELGWKFVFREDSIFVVVLSKASLYYPFGIIEYDLTLCSWDSSIWSAIKPSAYRCSNIGKYFVSTCSLSMHRIVK